MKSFSVTLCRRFARLRLLVFWYALFSATVYGQSSTRPQAMTSGSTTGSASAALLAEPKSQVANPFLPLVSRDIRLPVGVDGFCVVTLRERKEWLRGADSNQLVFDGKIYWFTSPRERAMFASTPRRYVPALGGDCVVSFAEDGLRIRGNPQYGILHDQRLFFFRGPAEQKQFQANPGRYAAIDLANDGLCLVSLVDQQRRLPGLPETTVIVDGLSYRFAGVYQQRKFLLNMRDYGVERPVTAEPDDTSEKPSIGQPPLQTPIVNSVGSRAEKGKPRDKSSVADVTNKAMGGYCPVSIHDGGVWTFGDPRYRVEFDGLTYLCAGEAEQERFTQSPNEYLPALGGNCVVTEIDENRRVAGSIYHASQYEGRLYLFAGAEQKKRFDTTTPEKYASADLAAAGSCIVNLVDAGRTVAGLPELVIWHQGKRYFFESTEHQAAFRKNTQRYVE